MMGRLFVAEHVAECGVWTTNGSRRGRGYVYYGSSFANKGGGMYGSSAQVLQQSGIYRSTWAICSMCAARMVHVPAL